MKGLVIGILAGVFLAVVLVYAHGEGFYKESNYERTYGMMGGYDMHEEVEQVFEEGTYADLESLREEYGMPIMPWIDSEQEFNDYKTSFDTEEHPGFGGCHHW